MLTKHKAKRGDEKRLADELFRHRGDVSTWSKKPVPARTPKAKRVRAWLVLWAGQPGQVLWKRHWTAALAKATFRPDCLVNCIVEYTPPRPAARRKGGK